MEIHMAPILLRDSPAENCRLNQRHHLCHNIRPINEIISFSFLGRKLNLNKFEYNGMNIKSIQTIQTNSSFHIIGFNLFKSEVSKVECLKFSYTGKSSVLIQKWTEDHSQFFPLYY